MTRPVQITDADIARYEAIIRERDAKAGVVREPEAEAGGAWYIIRTNPNCEDRACWALAGAGILYFWPQRRKAITHARKRVLVDRPLFPRYMFVFLRSDQSFFALRRCYGVESVLCENGEPYALRKAALSALDDLMELEASGDLDDAIYPKKGDVVTINTGKLANFQATVLKAHDEQRIDVMIKMFGVDKLVTVPLDRLDDAKSAA